MKRNDDNSTEHDVGGGAENIRHLSPPSFAALGNGQLAYVRPTTHEDEPAFAVCSADGQQLALVASRDLAFALIRQNDMEPVSVH